MKKIFKIGIASVLAGLVFVGCTSLAVYNVKGNPIEAKVSSEKVYEAIKRAGHSKGWQVSKVKPGLAEAKINLRKHAAVVEIPYTLNSFSIKYKDSTGLNYNSENGTIHRNYNGWVQNLENQINFEIGEL